MFLSQSTDVLEFVGSLSSILVQRHIPCIYMADAIVNNLVSRINAKLAARYYGAVSSLGESESSGI